MKDKKHIHGFKVPKDYFDNLEERVMQNIAMDQLPKDTGMRVPDGYFEQLEDRVMAKTITPEKKSPKVINLNSWWKVAVAASVIGIGIWLLPGNPKANEMSNTMVNSEFTIDRYIDDMIFDMPDASLIEMVDDYDIDMSFSNQINKEEVEEYLMENLDLSTLLSYE